MVKKNQFLGTDKQGKPWYVLERPEEDSISFFVFPGKYRDSDIILKYQYVVRAHVSRISKNRAIIEDFVHTNYKGKQVIQNPKEMIRPPSLFEELLADSGIDGQNLPNWENRGIGKMLSAWVEKWAFREGIRVIFGFLSDADDMEKLQKMYTKWGWHVRIFGKIKPKIQGYGYAIGIIMKNLTG